MLSDTAEAGMIAVNIALLGEFVEAAKLKNPAILKLGLQS
jgi:hypothetical protein